RMSFWGNTPRHLIPVWKDAPQMCIYLRKQWKEKYSCPATHFRSTAPRENARLPRDIKSPRSLLKSRIKRNQKLWMESAAAFVKFPVHYIMRFVALTERAPIG